jgi:hypothetical protein
LRKLARRSIEQFDEIRDALLGVDHRPGLAEAASVRSSSVTVVVSEKQAAGFARVQVLIDGMAGPVEPDVRVPGGLDLAGSTSGLVLGEVGRKVGALVYPGVVGEAVDRLLDGLQIGSAVDLRVELDGPGVVGVPVEAGLLPSARAPALLAGVRMARVVAGVRAPVPAPAPGPLKVLVAVGAPDEGLTRNAPLDIEAEMGSILAAVGQAVSDGRAQVRVLQVANAADRGREGPARALGRLDRERHHRDCAARRPRRPRAGHHAGRALRARWQQGAAQGDPRRLG